MLWSTGASDFDGLLERLSDAIWQLPELDEDQLHEIDAVLHEFSDLGPSFLRDGVAILAAELDAEMPPTSVLVCIDEPFEMAHEDLHFVWLLLGNDVTHDHMDTALEFAHLMGTTEASFAFRHATSVAQLEAAYEHWLDRDLHHQAHIPDELQHQEYLFHGLIRDARRRLPLFMGDITDGLNMKAFASTVFLFFACLAPSVAFGGFLYDNTGGQIGVTETLIATAVTGVLYALTSGQPLSILGSTGPITVFFAVLYGLSQAMGFEYLPFVAWVGIWTAVYLTAIVAVNGARWIRHFTRFTDDTFGALISVIFVVTALQKMIGGFLDGSHSETALFALVLAAGTYIVASNLAAFRRSPYLRHGVREFLSDFGPAIAIVTMTMARFLIPDVDVAGLSAPDTVGTTMDRGWFVNPLQAPPWVIAFAAVPALLGTILVYLDHFITIRLVNNPANQLDKPGGYNLDLLIVAALIFAFALFGLPWTVAATVRSLNHVRSLAEVDDEERITSVVETRLTGLGIHLLIGACLLALPLIKLIPMPVLYGLFLYMGIASTRGNQFFERCKLIVTDPHHLDPTHYLRAVPRNVSFAYTAVQATGLAVLWAVKASPIAVLFPLFIAMLVPIRFALERFFKPEHLALLDAEEVPSEERTGDRMAGP